MGHSKWTKFKMFLFFVFLRSWVRAPQKLLAIYKPDGIGDFVLSAGVLRDLINFYGIKNVSLIVSHEIAKLAGVIFPGLEVLPIVPGHSGWRDKLVDLPALRAVLQKYSYKEVVCLRHYRTFYDDTILRAFQAERIVLLTNQDSRARWVAPTRARSNLFYVVPDSQDRQTSESFVPREWSFHAAVASASLGRSVAPESLRPEWDVHKIPRTASPPFVLISPLAGRNIRDLPLPLVQAAARRAFADGLAKLVITGASRQSAQLALYADALRADLPSCSVEVAHPEDLPALVRLVATAALIVTTETSIAHLAAALDQPTLIIIGGGHYGWFAPWRRSDKQVWLTNKLPCFDCNWRCLFPKPICITDVTAEQVEAALPVAQ